ncbi:SNPC4 protein, partial [Alectura lathami]|nr:SNPC4 protein [Alectura lathami]
YLKEVDREEDNSDDDIESSLPEDPETCLQMNRVYQEVIQEKIEEVKLLLAQNQEQQKEIMCEIDGGKTTKAGDGRNLPANIFLGHFMKTYFKDKTTGLGPPSNEDAKEKAAQGIKSFEQLLSTKWKSREKVLLQKSVVSDRLQRLLQPKLMKLSYCNQKLEKVKTEMEKQILEKQIKEVEREIEAINQLPESDLLGDRFDEHDWEKISNIHFDGQRSSEELRKFWQNWEHPSINKDEWTEEETERLKKIAAEHGYLDWQAVAQELGTNRTAFQCLQKYQTYNKDLKRKEWTKDEDLMLLELVQEMRVGSHIPYKKIAYYMEGRDSAQLIYRWTKSVDPSLKKGPWTPEEDAMLLAAVKKYGERDWYKIRTEVPGRSDAQCRDRYLKALHYDVKKGRWTLEEEQQLIDLVQKHGLGHWSKIASELPHRTRSQCLSKWKLMIGCKVLYITLLKRSRQGKRRYAEESSSCSDSSSEDIELNLTDASEEEDEGEEEEEKKNCKEEFAVPSIDLWIPTQMSTQESCKGGYQTSSLLSSVGADAKTSSSRVPNATCDGGKDRIIPVAGMLKTFAPLVYSVSASGFLGCGKQVLRVTLEDVRRVLRQNTYFQRKLQSKVIKPSATSLTETSAAGSSAAQKLRGLQSTMNKTYRQERERLRRRNLDRKLLMAVTPWVGNVLLPCTLQTGRFYHTKAYSIREKMRSISLSSTPLFTLFIQLFQIDTNGCMKVIRKRRADAMRLQQVLDICFYALPTGVLTKVEIFSGSAAFSASQASDTDSAGSAPAVHAAVPAQAQRQKPKTVSELLREKRLRESMAKKAMQRTVLVAPQMLLSGPLIIQHPPQQIIPSAQAGSKPGAVGCTDGQVLCVPAPLSAFTAVEGSTSTPAVLENHSSLAPKAGESPGSSQGTVVQSSKELNEQALQSSPERGEPGNSKLSLPTPVTCELNGTGPCGPQQGPVNVLPALVAPQTGSHLVPNSMLPITWVVTPQALLPTSVQTVVGVPRGLPAAAERSRSQASVTCSGNVSGLGVPPVPAGVSVPHPSCAGKEAPSSEVAAGTLLGKTAGVNRSASPFPVASASAGCSISSVSSATSASSAVSKDSGSSAAQNALPADAPAQCTQLLPQPQLPARTQGSDSHSAASSAAQVLEHRAAASKPPSAQPTTSSAGKTLLDYSLISLEDEELVKKWMSGKEGVQVPPLQTRLPYFPPFLCNLKTLSKLLLQKAALEKQAARLLPSDAGQGEGTGVDLNAITELVHQKLGNDPAFLLLKARFLAAFTLPALLATLPPPKVATTLSASGKQYEDSDEEEWQSEKEASE